MSVQDELISYDVGKNQYVAYVANQGTLTNAEVGIGADLKTTMGKTWTSPIEEGYLVTLDTTGNQVVVAAVNEQVLVGFAAHKPISGKASKYVPDDDSGSPYSDILFVVDVEIFGDFQRTVARDTAGTTPVLQESCLHSNATAHQWEAKTSLTNTNFVTSFTASTITMIWGYWGKMDI